jgi:hypothetical protein
MGTKTSLDFATHATFKPGSSESGRRGARPHRVWLTDA